MLLYVGRIFSILSFLIVIVTPIISADPVKIHISGSNASYELSSSLNFRFDNQVVNDEKQEGAWGKPGVTLGSTNMFDWHIKQAPMLAEAYYNYQDPQTNYRNVSRLMVSIIYKEGENYKIKNISLDKDKDKDKEIVFISGEGLDFIQKNISYTLKAMV